MVVNSTSPVTASVSGEGIIDSLYTEEGVNAKLDLMVNGNGMASYLAVFGSCTGTIGGTGKNPTGVYLIYGENTSKITVTKPETLFWMTETQFNAGIVDNQTGADIPVQIMKDDFSYEFTEGVIPAK